MSKHVNRIGLRIFLLIAVVGIAIVGIGYVGIPKIKPFRERVVIGTDGWATHYDRYGRITRRSITIDGVTTYHETDGRVINTIGPTALPR